MQRLFAISSTPSLKYARFELGTPFQGECSDTCRPVAASQSTRDRSWLLCVTGSRIAFPCMSPTAKAQRPKPSMAKFDRENTMTRPFDTMSKDKVLEQYPPYRSKIVSEEKGEVCNHPKHTRLRLLTISRRG